MTVALAFKAFAKAIPSLTPFLATSDPSVLRRILAYIRGLPCSSNIFPKSEPYLYGPIVLIWSDRRRPSTGQFRSSFVDQRASGDGPVVDEPLIRFSCPQSRVERTELQPPPNVG